MASMDGNDSQSESLNGSWVALGARSRDSVSPSPVKVAQFNTLSMEKLLREAQRESSGASSRVESMSSGQASPRSLCGELMASGRSSDIAQGGLEMANTDWVWDWSSRPEVVPPSDSRIKMKHPASKWKKLSIRNTRLMDVILHSIENLPLLLFTHACTFFLGAATVLIYLKKYCNWSPLSSAAVDG